MAVGDREKEVLELLSIFPRRASLEELANLSGESRIGISRALEGLLEHQMIAEEEEEGEVFYRFTHGLIKSFICGRLPKGRRKLYNREAARRCEEEYRETGRFALIPSLIHYFGEAGDTYKKYFYRLEYMKVFFSGQTEIYPELSVTFSSALFMPGETEETAGREEREDFEGQDKSGESAEAEEREGSGESAEAEERKGRGESAEAEERGECGRSAEAEDCEGRGKSGTYGKHREEWEAGNNTVAEQMSRALISLAGEIRALPAGDRGNRELRMRAEYLMGKYDLAAGDYRRGLRNIHACLDAARGLADGEYQMNACLQLVYYGIQAGDPEIMGESLGSCEELLKSQSYPAATVFAVERLRALYYMKKEEYGRAEELLDRLIPRMERECRTDSACRAGLSACYNYRGEILMAFREWDEAVDYIGRALVCGLDSCPTAGRGVAYTDLGIILFQTDHYDKALDYLRKARECFRELSVQWGRAKEEVYSALLELKLERPGNALTHYEAACRFAGKDKSAATRALLKEVYGELKSVYGWLKPPDQEEKQG